MASSFNFDKISIEDNTIFKNCEVVFLNYHAKVSELYTIEAHLYPVFDIAKLQMSDILHKKITFIVEYQDQKKYYSGIIDEIKQKIVLHNEGNATLIQLKISPYISILKNQNGFRSFHEKTSVDIIKYFMDKLKIYFEDFKYRDDMALKHVLIQRTDVVQYGESDYDFLMRMLIEDNHAFYFTHNSQGHEIVFTENLQASFDEDIKKNKSKENFTYEVLSEKNTHFKESNTVHGYKKLNTVKYQLLRSFSYDFRNFPHVSETETVKENKKLSWHTLSNLFKKSKKVLFPGADEISYHEKQLDIIKNTGNHLVSFASYAHELILGSHVTLNFFNIANILPFKKFYICGIEENYQVGLDCVGSRNMIAVPAENKFHFLPQEHLVSRNKIYGTATAIVLGEKGLVAELQEKMQIKIRFMWHPLEGKTDSSENTELSNFVTARLSQSFAGSGRGAVVLPRAGDEVLVSFENGDLERPIVIRSLYNNKNYMPNNTLKELETTHFRNSPTEKNEGKKYNELIIQEKLGEEKITVNAKKDFSLTIEKDLTFHSKTCFVNMSEFDIELNSKNSHIKIEDSNVHLTAKEALQLNTKSFSVKNESAELIDILSSLCDQLSKDTTSTLNGPQPLVGAPIYATLKGKLDSFKGGGAGEGGVASNEKQSAEHTSFEKNSITEMRVAVSEGGIGWNKKGAQAKNANFSSKQSETPKQSSTHSTTVEKEKEDEEEEEELTEEFKIFVATVNGEAGGCSVTAWKAVAHVIMNRVGVTRWSRFKTVIDIIKKTGFDAYKDPLCFSYIKAKKKLDDKSYKNDRHLTNLITAIKPIYNKEEPDFTNGANQYYSPKAQRAGHKKNPKRYLHEDPIWATNGEFERLSIDGLKETDDFIFFRLVIHSAK